MQVSGISSPSTPLGTGSARYTATVDQYARTLNDPRASLDDQLAAYKGLYDLSSATGTAAAPLWLTNKDDLARAQDAMNNSAFTKRMNEVGSRFTGMALSAGYAARGGDMADAVQAQVDVIGRFSDDDQKILVKAYFMMDGRGSDGSGVLKFETGAEWKAQYQRFADKLKAQRATENPPVQVTLSDRALAILANRNVSGKASTPAEQAHQLLGERGAPVSNADVALQLLKKAAEPKDAAKSSGGEKATNSVETLVDTLAKRTSDVADRSQQAHASTPARDGQNA